MLLKNTKRVLFPLLICCNLLIAAESAPTSAPENVKVTNIVVGVLSSGKFIPFTTGVSRNTTTSTGTTQSILLNSSTTDDQGKVLEIKIEACEKYNSSHQAVYKKSTTKTNQVVTNQETLLLLDDGNYSLNKTSTEAGVVKKIFRAPLPILDDEKIAETLREMKINQTIDVNSVLFEGDGDTLATLTRNAAEETTLADGKAVTLPKYSYAPRQPTEPKIKSTVIYTDANGDFVKMVLNSKEGTIVVFKTESEVSIDQIKSYWMDLVNNAAYADAIGEVTPTFKSFIEKSKQGIFDRMHPAGVAKSCELEGIEIITDEKSSELFKNRTLLAYRLTGTVKWKSPLIDDGKTTFKITYDAKNGAWQNPEVIYTNGATFDDVANITWGVIGAIKELSK